MPDDRMQLASDLIRAKDYEAARAILVTIHTPQAQQWITEIDRRRAPVAARRKTHRWRNLGCGGCLVILLVIGVLGSLLGGGRGQRAAQATAVPTQRSAALATQPPTVLPTSRPTTAPTTTPGFSEAAYVEALQNGVFILAGGRNVESIRVPDGRDAGGERGVILSYLTTESTEVGQIDELVDLFEAVAATIRADDLDLDSVTLLAGTASGQASGTFTTSTANLLAFTEGRMRRSDFLAALDVVAF